MSTQYKISAGTYWEYFKLGDYNKYLIPLAIILFILSQTAIVAFYRFLTMYNQVNEGTNYLFSNINTFWITLGLIQVAYFILLTLKFIVLNTIIIGSNYRIHKLMVSSLIRCKLAILGKSPSSEIMNKFMNDINILDYQAPYTALFLIDNFFSIIAMLINVFQINLFFLIPGCLALVIFFIFFVLISDSIISIKSLDLQTKSGMFNTAFESMNGILQINLLNQKDRFVSKFA